MMSRPPRRLGNMERGSRPSSESSTGTLVGSGSRILKGAPRSALRRKSAHQGHSAEPGRCSEADIQASTPSDCGGWEAVITARHKGASYTTRVLIFAGSVGCCTAVSLHHETLGRVAREAGHACREEVAAIDCQARPRRNCVMCDTIKSLRKRAPAWFSPGMVMNCACGILAAFALTMG